MEIEVLVVNVNIALFI